MPTKEWFRENPKVTAYISQDLYAKLDSYMKAEGIKKVSQAVTIILEEKFNIRKSTDTSEFQKELDILKDKVAQIELLLKHDIKGESIISDKNSLESLDGKYNQLTIDEAPGENRNKEESTKVTQSSSSPKKLTTKEVESLTGLSARQLEYKRQRDQFPCTIKGHTIIRWVERERKLPHSNVWEVQEASPS